MKAIRHILICVLVANVLLLVTPGRGFIMFLHLHGAALLHLWTSVFLAGALALVYRMKKKNRLARVALPIIASLAASLVAFATLSKGAYFSGIPSAEELWSFTSTGFVVGGVLTSVCWLPVGILASVLYVRYSRVEKGAEPASRDNDGQSRPCAHDS